MLAGASSFSPRIHSAMVQHNSTPYPAGADQPHPNESLPNTPSSRPTSTDGISLSHPAPLGRSSDPAAASRRMTPMQATYPNESRGGKSR
jgi:hypothetical protein